MAGIGGDDGGGWNKVVSKKEKKKSRQDSTSLGASIQHGSRQHQNTRGTNFSQYHGYQGPRTGEFRRPYFSKEHFIKLLSMKVPEVIKQISAQIKSFQHFLETSEICKKDMSIVLQLLLKVCQGLKFGKTNSDTSTIFSELFSDMCPEFQKDIKFFVRQCAQDLRITDLQAVIDLFCTLLEVMPQSCWTVVPVRELSDSAYNNEELMQNRAFKSKLEDLCALYESIEEQQKVSSIKKSKQIPTSLKWDNSEYRDIQVLPEWHEVRDPNPPARLRPNVISEEYEDWMHYYDVQFRLLREDFLAPLRKGIKDYRDGKEGREVSNVRVYRNVQIARPDLTKDGLCHEITIHMNHMKRINWEHSKRLIYGSLMCLSPDEFEHTAYFATVSDRDPEKLKAGRLTVMFQVESEIFMHRKKKTLFVMLESMAFFEASSHVLRSLQLAEATSMPFTKHLIKNNSDKVDPPKYLSICPREAVSYDMCQIIKKQYIRNPKCARKYSNLKILFHEWPSLDDTDLDDSQLRAMKMALSQEVVVIQGPPGTGKTYIGLKIVQALLKNKSYWSPDVAPKQVQRQRRAPSGGPILIMCFTNHALDQFLEGILDLHEENKPNLIRVGGRSKSEKLQQYNLTVIMREKRKPRENMREQRGQRENKHEQRVPKEIEDNFFNKKREVKRMHEICLGKLSRYSDPTHSFVGLTLIRTGMSEHHVQSLEEEGTSPEERKHALEIWLGLYIIKEKDHPQVHYRYQHNVGQEEEESSESESEYVSANSSPHESGEDEPCEENNGDANDAGDTERACQMELMKSMYSKTLESQHDASNSAKKKERKGNKVALDEISGLANSTNPQDEDEFVHAGDTWNFGASDPYEEPMQEQTSTFHNAENGYGLDSTRPSKSARKLKIKKKKRRRFEVVEHEKYKKLLEKMTRNLTDTRYGALEAEEIENVHQLEFDDRWQLYNYWHSKYREKSLEQLEKTSKQYNEACKDLKAAKQRMERYALENAHIVGMTTTGTAKYQHILHMIKPKIVIVEEAAEVMESHIVSSLNAGTQHLILIGDHKQLRPKPNDYDMVEKYKLDISLFERLVINNFPFVTLENQHRMRPEIAELVRPIYNKLINHSSVLNYPKVKGICKNMFLIDHSEPEGVSIDMSHESEHEALYLIALCQFLLKKGYAPNKITILATYSGQFLLMRKLLREKAIVGVQITTVDNFQGEENDIILLSLVRSNNNNNIGFLKEENRVCVSLSRARQGFYCIGNFSMLKRQPSIWQTIIPDMESKGNIGTALEVHCVNHPDEKFEVINPGDFDEGSPEGGCKIPCGARLKCGHTCPKKCHLTDPDHRSFSCLKPCSRKCELGHDCTRRCYEQCVCLEAVEKKFPGCEHTKLVKCHVQIATLRCEEKVPKDIPQCGHTQLVPCYMTPKAFHCKERVEKDMVPCGHRQSMMCHENPRHQKCGTVVPKAFPCGHTEDMPCHTKIYLLKCKSECEKFCSNQHKCTEICHASAPCPPCRVKMEKVLPKCGHIQSVDCGGNPDFVNCMDKCKQTCSRGHPCKLYCYQKCRICTQEIEHTPPTCGHKNTIQCHELERYVCTMYVSKEMPCGHYKTLLCSKDPEYEICAEIIPRTLSCGHLVQVPCGKDIEEVQCPKIVEKELKCGHTQETECYRNVEEIECTKQVPVTLQCKHQHLLSCVTSRCLATFKCKKVCKKTLDCGHVKKAMCFQNPTRDSCEEPTTKNLDCGHSVNVPCNETHMAHKCRQKCEKELSCGHRCKLQCWQKCVCEEYIEQTLECKHSAFIKCTDKIDNYTCKESCKKKLSCGHECRKLCYEPCTISCEVRVPVICDQGHERKEKCFMKLYSRPCTEKCTKILPCGHPCKKLCHQQCNMYECRVKCDKVYACRHSHRLPCSTPPEKYPCDLICRYRLSCGHLCQGKCSECRKTRIHQPCKSTNALRHFCGGDTRQPCLDLRSKHTESATGDKYEGQVIVCKHKEVPWKCSGEIKKCDAPCKWFCSPECPRPQRCSKICSEMCDREPCDEKCQKMMPCEHRCIGLCGEPCITVCPQCNGSQFKHHLVLSDTYSEDVPYIQLSCGHIVSVLDMEDFVATKLQKNNISLLLCPHKTCSRPLSSSYRYGNLVKESFLRIGKIVHIIGNKSGNFDDLFKIYSETREVLSQPQMEEQCPRELFLTFNKAMKNVCEKQPRENEKQFVLFLIAKLTRLCTHQRYQLSNYATAIIDNLQRWLKKNLHRPRLSVQVVYDLISEYFRLHLEVMRMSLEVSTTQAMRRIMEDPYSRISANEFTTMSRSLDGQVSEEILSEVDKFHPRIKSGNWKMCSAGHFYCVPASNPNCNTLKVYCSQCAGKIKQNMYL